MYNINDHYDRILQYINKKSQLAKLAYFFPFGSTKFEHLEFLGADQSSFYLFCFDQEPLDAHYNSITINSFEQLTLQSVKKDTINFYSKILNNEICAPADRYYYHIKRPTILLNTEKDSNEKNKILKKYGFIDCYYFFHALAAADWFRGYRYSYEIIPIKERKISKKFISYNRITGSSRIYRALFVSLLDEKNLLDYGHISFSKKCPVHNDIEYSIFHIIKNFNLDKNYIIEKLNHISSLPDLRIDSSIEHPIQNSSFEIGNISKPMESFVHVVTETCFWETKKHLTEKIFKPIVLKQPFLLLGCANNLAYLKEYGFKTFDRWWDESYDDCQDPLQRINMVVKILEDLCKIPNTQLESMLVDMQEVLEHNYALFYSFEFIESIWKELETNLDHAIAQLPP